MDPVPYSSPLGGRHNELRNRVSCPKCRDAVPNLVEDFAAGDLVCANCGFVIGDRIIDTRSEWRTFSNDGGGTDDPSRVGGPSNPLLDGGQLDTLISARDGYSGTSKELSRLQGRATSKPGERARIDSFKAITIMCERIGLPKVIADRAKHMYKMVDDEKLLRGKGNDGVIAACIYIACREEKVPRTFKEISSLTLVPKKDIGRCFKALIPFLETKMATVSTEDFMARFCSHLRLPMEVQRAAVTLSKRAMDTGCTAGKSPITVAAAGIFLVSQLFPDTKKSYKEISFVSGVSEVTIKNAYKDLYTRRHELVPAELLKSVDGLPLAQ